MPPYNARMPHPALSRSPGPLERTAMELDDLRRAAAFRRGRELTAQRRLRESDGLVDLVEQCRLRGYVLLPTQVWARVVHFVRGVDPALRDELGIDRHPDHVGDVLFAAQEVVLRQRIDERQPRMAEIIPLFGRDRGADDLASAQ
jgi:hypothetical protein